MLLLWIQCSVYRAYLFIAVTEKYSEKAELHSPRASRFIMTQLSPQAVLQNFIPCLLSWSGNYNCYDKQSQVTNWSTQTLTESGETTCPYSVQDASIFLAQNCSSTHAASFLYSPNTCFWSSLWLNRHQTRQIITV